MPRMTLEYETGNWLKFCPRCCEVYRIVADGYFEALEIIKEHFGPSNFDGTDDGLQGYCLTCMTAKRQGRQVSKRRDIVLQDQGGMCDICGTEVSFINKTACFDHCHTSGVNRGILCGPCNNGMVGVDYGDDWIVKATAYRNKYRK